MIEPSIVTLNDQQQVASTFAVGEPVTLRLTVTNFGDEAATVGSTLCPTFSFRIRDAASHLVWSFGSDTPGYQTLGSCAGYATFPPGESPPQEFTWDQRAISSTQVPDGAQVPVGEYVVTAAGTDCGAKADATFAIQ